MNKTSEQRLSNIHPVLAQRARIIAERLAQQGIIVEIVQGFRSAEEQDALYRKGRRGIPGEKKVTNAQAWQSYHCYGIAVDFCIFENGKPNWEAPRSQWLRIAEAAEALGLESGARWKFVDMPHVQINGLSIAQCRALYERGGLALVWQRASAALKAVEEVEEAVTPTPSPLHVGNYPITFPAATTSRVEAAQPRPQTTLPPRPRHVEEVTAKVGIAGAVLTVLVAAWHWLVAHRWWALVVWVGMVAVWAIWGPWREWRESRNG